jgi:hypothetical protein
MTRTRMTPAPMTPLLPEHAIGLDIVQASHIIEINFTEIIFNESWFTAGRAAAGR